MSYRHEMRLPTGTAIAHHGPIDLLLLPEACSSLAAATMREIPTISEFMERRFEAQRCALLDEAERLRAELMEMEKPEKTPSDDLNESILRG
jgi:hypothetical protein